MLFLHGQGATLERDVHGAPGDPAPDRRLRARTSRWSRRSSPSTPPDSSAGNFWKPGHFAAYIDEAAERLMRLYGDKRVGPHFNAAGVVIVSYSGGYLSTAYRWRMAARRIASRA